MFFRDFIRRLILRRKTLCHFGDDDIIVSGYHLNAVHIISDKIEIGFENDFYLDTGYDIYLLRLRKSYENSIEIYPAENGYPVYIVCCADYSIENINSVINDIFERLKKSGFPKIKNPEKKINI